MKPLLCLLACLYVLVWLVAALEGPIYRVAYSDTVERLSQMWGQGW